MLEANSLSKHNTAAPAATRESLWHRLSCIRRSMIPEAYWHWLTDSASLTRRVIACCSGKFQVRVIEQRWERPLRNEASVLVMKNGVYGLVRQVYLLCNEKPWVYARTVIPAETLVGPQRRLAHLETRSLGAMLFADSTMQRSEVEVSPLARQDKLYWHATRDFHGKLPEQIWGRRTIFRLQNRPLLVTEIFLPPTKNYKF